MPAQFIHGYKGKFLIGATDFQVTEFSVDWEIEAEAITHTGAGGAQVMLDGVEKISGSVTFVYDLNAKPTIAPQQLKPRSVATIHFKPDGVDNFSADFLCSKFSFKSGPKAGVVYVTVTVESTSAITYPVS